MFTSKDDELLRLRRVHSLPETTRFFLLEYHDHNYYYYGLLTGRAWSVADYNKSVKAVEALAHNEEPNSKLAKLVAARCAERRPGDDDERWLELIENLWNPRRFVRRLQAIPDGDVQDAVHDLSTLLHCIPQACDVGVMARVTERLALHKEPWVDLDETAPWTSTDSTLALLRPLEYFFGIGDPHARNARVHALRSRGGFLLGAVFDFHHTGIQTSVVREVEGVIEALTIRDLAAQYRATPITGALSDEPDELLKGIHRVVPAHSTLAWVVNKEAAELRSAFGLPWEKAMSHEAETSVMATKQELDLKQHTVALSWLRAELSKPISENPSGPVRTVRTSIGTGSWSALPGELLSLTGRHHPLAPSHCLTLRTTGGRDALQILLPADSVDAYRYVVSAHEQARISSCDISSSSRYPGWRFTLPDTWVYHPTTSDRLRLVVESLRRGWAGEETAKQRPLLLFHGEPGTGKSELAVRFAHNVVGDESPLRVCAASLKSDKYGETEKNIKKLLQSLHCRGPRVVIVDEFESLGVDALRDEIANGVTSFLKVALDEFIRYATSNAKARCVLIATTNHPDRLDVAVRSKCREIEFLWGHAESRRLLDVAARQRWNKDAQRVALEAYGQKLVRDPRKFLELIELSEAQVSSRRGLLYADHNVPRVVRAEHVERVLGKVPAEQNETLAASTGREMDDDDDDVKVMRGEAESLRMLNGVLVEATEAGWTDNTDLKKRFSDNEIAFIGRHYPAWKKAYDAVKSANRKRANG